MSIRPVVLNGMIQRTQDVGTLKQNEDNKPALEQQNLQTQFAKETIRHMQKVVHADDTENQEKKYDAKEKGDNEYQGQQKSKKKQPKKTEGKVIPKSAAGSFDIKI